MTFMTCVAPMITCFSFRCPRLECSSFHYVPDDAKCPFYIDLVVVPEPLSTYWFQLWCGSRKYMDVPMMAQFRVLGIRSVSHSTFHPVH